MYEAGPDELYAEHLQTLMRRADAALAALGFDALVIHAGCPPTLFLDDQAYPYKVNPHFKAWVPIVDNPQSVLVYRPGLRPRVLFHQPSDYWHLAAPMPREPWSESVDLTPMPDPAKAGAALGNARASRLYRTARVLPARVLCAEPGALAQRRGSARAAALRPGRQDTV